MFKERIEYDDSKTLEEAFRKENIFYDQNKNKIEKNTKLKNKRRGNFDQKNENTMIYKNTWNNYRGYHKNNYKTLSH